MLSLPLLFAVRNNRGVAVGQVVKAQRREGAKKKYRCVFAPWRLCVFLNQSG
jgi:hypothetical protein